MSFKYICKYIICISLFVTAPAENADAQVGRAVKSVVDKPSAVTRLFRKKATKEVAEKALEQETKALSREMVQRAIAKNAAVSLFDPASKKIGRDVLQEVAEANIRKTFITKAGKEISESALRTVSKEFAQKIGRSASKESQEIFAKRLGTEASQELYEVSAKESMQKSAFDTHKSWLEKLKDKYHTLRLKLLHTIEKSKLYKDLLEIYKKGAIVLTDKEMVELLANPQYLRVYVKTKTGNKNVIEFLIRLKMSNPEQVRQILQNPKLREYIESYIRRTTKSQWKAGAHEWLMTKNLEKFLLDTRLGKDGDLLALALCKFSQKTDNVLFKNGGKHIGKGGGENSGKFHIGLSAVIDKTIEEGYSIEALFINIRRYAKQNLEKDVSYNEFLEILYSIFEAA